MTIHTGFGFAIELFIIVFSLLCWLTTPVKKSVTAISKEDLEEKILFEIGNNQELILKVLEEFSIIDTRRLASLLKGMGALSPDTKLSGKGISKTVLLEKIRAVLPHYQNAVTEYICNRMND